MLASSSFLFFRAAKSGEGNTAPQTLGPLSSPAIGFRGSGKKHVVDVSLFERLAESVRIDGRRDKLEHAPRGRWARFLSIGSNGSW